VRSSPSAPDRSSPADRPAAQPSSARDRPSGWWRAPADRTRLHCQKRTSPNRAGVDLVLAFFGKAERPDPRACSSSQQSLPIACRRTALEPIHAPCQAVEHGYVVRLEIGCASARRFEDGQRGRRRGARPNCDTGHTDPVLGFLLDGSCAARADDGTRPRQTSGPQPWHRPAISPDSAATSRLYGCSSSTHTGSRLRQFLLNRIA
jgi:hypothetical protein